MANIRRPIFWDLISIQERMNRLFDDLFVQGREGEHSVGRWSPSVDIYETEESIVLLAEVPGIEEEELDIEISNNVLTLKGNRKSEGSGSDETIHRLERGQGPFKRTFILPSEVLQEQVKAVLKLGLLKVTLPKVEVESLGVKIERT